MAKSVKQLPAPADLKELPEGPPVQLSNGKVRVNGEEQATRPIPKAFEDSEVLANRPEPAAVEEPEPYQPTQALNDDEFADFKAKVVAAATDTNEGSTKKKPVPARGGKGHFLKKGVKTNEAAPPEKAPEPAAPPSPASAKKPPADRAEPASNSAESKSFPPELLEEAAAFDLSPDDFPTPAALEKAVGKMHKTILAKFGGQAKAPEQAAPIAPATAAPVAKATEPAPAPSDEKLANARKSLESLDPEFGPAIQKYIDESNSVKDQRIAALEAQLATIGQQRQQHAERSHADAFDDTIERNPTFKSVLGEGRYVDVRGNAEIVGKRTLVNKEMQRIAKSYHDAGIPVPKFDTLMKRAIASAFPDEFATSAVQADRTQRATKVAARQSQFTSPPTHQTAPAERPTKGKEAAEAAVTEKLREFGAIA